VGHDASRGAFAISYFDAGTVEHPSRIHLQDVQVAIEWSLWRAQNDWRWSDSREGVENQNRARQAEGMMVVHSFDAQRYHDATGLKRHPLTEVVVERGSFARGFSGQPFINIDGAKRIVFRDCHFRQPPGSAPANIDPHAHLRDLFGMVEEVRFENCTSENVEFRIYHATGVAVRDPHCPGSEVVYRKA